MKLRIERGTAKKITVAANNAIVANASAQIWVVKNGSQDSLLSVVTAGQTVNLGPYINTVEFNIITSGSVTIADVAADFSDPLPVSSVSVNSSPSQGGSGGTSLLTAAFEPRLQLVGQRCGLGQGGDTSSLHPTYPFITMHQRVVFPNGADAIQLVYPNIKLTSGSSEQPLYMPPVYAAIGVMYNGGTGRSAGQIDTFPAAAATAAAPLRVKILAVSGGVPTNVQILDPGLYYTPLADNTAPSTVRNQDGSSGSVGGATASFTWKAGHYGLRIGIEKVWNVSDASPTTLAFVTSGISQPVINNTELLANFLVPLDDFLITPLIPLDVPIGGAIGLRVSGVGVFPQSRYPISTNYMTSPPVANKEAAPIYTTWTDYSTSGTIGTTINAGLCVPALILGIPKRISPTFMCRGDSKNAGAASGAGSFNSSIDVMDNDGNIGPFEKAFALTGTLPAPWANVSCPGESLQHLIGNAYQTAGFLKMVALARPTAVKIALYTNDYNASSSNASLQLWEQRLIDAVRGLGVKYIYTETCAPFTQSVKYVRANPTIAAGGSGYAISSTFNVTLAGGTLASGAAATVNVTTNGSGVVTAVNSYTNNGSYTGGWLGDSTPATPNSPTGGSGTGLQLNVLYGGWSLQADQSVDPYGANAKALVRNAALVAGTWANYDFFIDNRSICEQVVGGMQWKTDGTFNFATGDGVHLSPALITLCAANEALTCSARVVI